METGDVALGEVERLNFLVEAAATLLGNLDADAVLPQVLEVAERVLAADAHALWRYDPGADEWSLRSMSGLSDTYRSEAGAAVRTNSAQIPLTGPIPVEDIAATPWLNEEHRAAHAREGNRAFLAVPLLHRDEVLGTLVFYYRAPRRFDESDIRAATALANVAAAAIGTAAIYRREREASERRRFLAEASALLASSLDDVTTLQEIARLAVSTLADWCIVDVLDPDTATLREVAVAGATHDVEETLRRMRAAYPPTIDGPQPAARALRTGETAIFPAFDPETLRATVRDERHYELITKLNPTSAIGVPLLARGQTLGAITFAFTSDDRAYGENEIALAEDLARHAALAVDNARVYRAEREARERLAVLADASITLASSLEYETTLANVARLVVPDLADWCAVDLLDDETGAIRRIAVVHRDPARVKWAERSRLLYAPDTGESEGTGRAIRTSESILYREITDRLLEETTRDAGHLEVLQSLGMRSAMVVPLITRGRTIGALMFVSESERAYDEDDLDFAEHIARRSAVAVDNARLYLHSEESRALLDTLFSTAPIGLAYFDREIRYVRINDALAEMNGLAREAHIGRRVDEVLPDLDPGVFTMYRRVLDTGEAIVDQEIGGETPAAPGVRREWLASYYPVRDPAGAVIGIGAVVSDVTERKRAGDAERFLAEASAILASSLDFERTLAEVAGRAVPALADACIVELAREDRATEVVAHVGEAGEHAVSAPITARRRKLGTITLSSAGPRRHDARDEALLEELGRRAGVAIDNARLYREVERRAQAAEALAFVGDGVFLVDRDDVVRLWNPAAAQLLQRPDEEVVGRRVEEVLPGWSEFLARIPVSSADETRMPRAETLPVEVDGRELWLSISGVAFAGGTVYAFRDLTEERAVERLKSDFVATVSHELRTPLAAIYGAALTLRRTDAPIDEPQRQGLLEVISGEADRLARIVNDILWASRLESGTMQLAIQSCDPGALAHAVVDAARAYLPPNLRLDLEVDGTMPRVAADPEKVRQVLANLVENAVKYSPDGGHIAVGVSAADHHVRFAVRDEGLGVPPAEHGRIFEKFYRLDPNLTRGVGGTGLGLYICRELVRRMAGSIWVESTGTGGSTFVVELPQEA